ncbi:MAG: NAD-binding protein [Gammaproteobacteria bacterium]|jgi:3-hydroxyisobutyrate dehydrogenase|nr:NAD-binding protein [Gammaproteobacteria bacterium]
MKIGFIGLGNVGAKLAGSLQRNGFELIVRDLDIAAAQSLLAGGAAWADSPKRLAQMADLIITCLPSPAVVSDVMESDDGIIAGLGPAKIWLEMSTTDEAEVKRLATLVEAAGAMSLDGPVSGGCHRAATGNISIFVGGDRVAFEKALPALTAMGRRILHAGPLGSASVLKVVTNYLCSVHLVALGEAMMVAKKAGMDLNTTFEAIRISSGNSFVHETESQVILNGSYNINFTMDLVIKDMSLFDGLADRLEVPLEVSPLVLDIFKDGQARYGNRAWSSMIVKRLEDACGTDLRTPGFPGEIFDDEAEEPGYEVVV